MALSYSAFDLAVLHLLDCIGEALEIEGRCNRHVVRWQKQFYLRFKCRQLGDGSRVGGEVGLRNEKVNRSGVKGVSSKKQSILAIEKDHGVRRVSRCKNHFQFTSAEVDPLTVLQRECKIGRASCREGGVEM